MAFRSLLLSRDIELVQTLSRVLKDLEIGVEACSEPFAAAKRLMDQHFDAILVDCEDEQGAGWVLQSARMATASKKSVTIAIVGAQGASRGGPRAGENFVIQKPIVLKQVESTLRAARGLMADSASPGSQAPAASSAAPEKPIIPAPSLPAAALPTAQGRPPAELFDELSAALDRLGPKAPPARPVPLTATLAGAAAAPAPAKEKPVISEPAPRKEPLPEPVLRSTPQAWPGVATPPSTPAKAEVATVLPLAATSAQMKPAVRPVEEQVNPNQALDEARRRMAAAPPPAWRTEVQEHREVAPPRFSSFGENEEPARKFPFKAIAVLMVLVSFALFGYSWYRGRNKGSAPAEQAQSPLAVPAQTPSSEAASNPAPAAAAPSNSPDTDSSAPIADSAAPAEPLAKPARIAPPKADAVAPDTTTDLAMPPAPLVVSGGKHAASSARAEAQLAPPSLTAVAGSGKSGLGGVVSSSSVPLPKLAASAPQFASAPAAPQRIRVSQGVTQGLLIRQVKPQYPSMAREMRIQGDVVLDAIIDGDGVVRDLKAVSGPAILVAPAIQAVRQWRYKPYLLNGQPVEVETQIKLQFRL